MASEIFDVIIIGAGQAGLASAYYLKRESVKFVLLDAENGSGGAWRHAWDSLHLFSPASYSSLPGWMMPTKTEITYPARDDVIDYLSRYEQRYNFQIERPVSVSSVVARNNGFDVMSDKGAWHSRVVLNATGTWRKPYIPSYPNSASYQRRQLHSANYKSPEEFMNQRVAIIGGGNSGAQILAELSKVAETFWVTTEDPLFLPDDVDGHALFQRATARVLDPNNDKPVGSLGDIVMVPPVKDAKERGVLSSLRPFKNFTHNGVIWQDGSFTELDAVIWCTGFRPALDHLQNLNVINEAGQVTVVNGQSVAHPGLWFTGYGNWTGAASATLLGSGRIARELIPQLVATL